MLGVLWITPVTDRSTADINTAKSYIKNHMGIAGALEPQKGCLNVSDLNRIESNMAFLAGLLEISIVTKEWDASDIPTSTDKARLLSNADAILTAADDYIGSDTPPTVPSNLTHFLHFNNLERVLKFVYKHMMEPLYTLSNDKLDVGGDYLVVRRVISDG